MLKFLLYLAIMCAVTILLESVPVLLTGDRKSWWKASVVCNVATNPLLNVVMLLVSVWLSRAFYFPVLIALEVVVVLAEAYLYHRLLNKVMLRCVLFSLIANGISFGAGLVLDRF